MAFTAKHRYLFRLTVGLVMVSWGVAVLVLDPREGSILPTILIVAGLTFVIAGITRYRRLGTGPEQDERTRRIGAWGISYSWFLTLLFMTALFWLDHARVLVLPAGIALAVSVVVMALSASLFQWYLFRKGDVE